MANRIGLETLKPAPGSRKPSKRIGMGVGSGHGKTSTRGQKGQGARSGGGRRRAIHEAEDAAHGSALQQLVVEGLDPADRVALVVAGLNAPAPGRAQRARGVPWLRLRRVGPWARHSTPRRSWIQKI